MYCQIVCDQIYCVLFSDMFFSVKEESYKYDMAKAKKEPIVLN